MNHHYSYSIQKRPENEGWKLVLYLDGVEMGVGVYAPDESIPDRAEAVKLAYIDAVAVGEEWVDSNE